MGMSPRSQTQLCKEYHFHSSGYPRARSGGPGLHSTKDQLSEPSKADVGPTLMSNREDQSCTWRSAVGTHCRGIPGEIRLKQESAGVRLRLQI